MIRGGIIVRLAGGTTRNTKLNVHNHLSKARTDRRGGGGEGCIVEGEKVGGRSREGEEREGSGEGKG